MIPKVHIVVLNWNNYSDTSACLSSLCDLRYENQEVIVVDNGSVDDSGARLREQFSHIQVIETGENLGFAGGCNVGIRHALAHGADFVWLLNNDTTTDSFALQALVDRANAEPRIGAIGSAIYSADAPQEVQAWGGGHVNFWLGRSGHFLSPAPDEEIDFITGASMLIPRKAIEEIGLLDENFFMYWEDADYCFRLRNATWRLAVAGESKVWHRQGSSVGKRSSRLDLYFNASAARFFEKHSAAPLLSLSVGVGSRLAKRVLLRDWERARAVLTGARQGRISQKQVGSHTVANLEASRRRP